MLPNSHPNWSPPSSSCCEQKPRIGRQPMAAHHRHEKLPRRIHVWAWSLAQDFNCKIFAEKHQALQLLAINLGIINLWSGSFTPPSTPITVRMNLTQLSPHRCLQRSNRAIFQRSRPPRWLWRLQAGTVLPSSYRPWLTRLNKLMMFDDVKNMFVDV